jgi:hypothetical protein
MSDIKPKRDNSLIGAAGVHFVASELSLRNLIALLTVRNTAGIDMVVINTSGTWNANLQVKTSGKKVNFWPTGKRYKEWVGDDNWYAFVRYVYDRNKNASQFEVFLESSKRVAKRAVTPQSFTPCWSLPKDEAERERLRRQWQELGKAL